jgi:hypothetical protein
LVDSPPNVLGQLLYRAFSGRIAYVNNTKPP